MNATITNEFHESWATVRTGKMSPANARKVASKLCGIKDCICGTGALKTRGRQRTDDGDEIEIVENRDGSVEVSVYNPTELAAFGS